MSRNSSILVCATVTACTLSTLMSSAAYAGHFGGGGFRPAAFSGAVRMQPRMQAAPKAQHFNAPVTKAMTFARPIEAKKKIERRGDLPVGAINKAQPSSPGIATYGTKAAPKQTAGIQIFGVPTAPKAGTAPRPVAGVPVMGGRNWPTGVGHLPPWTRVGGTTNGQNQVPLGCTVCDGVKTQAEILGGAMLVYPYFQTVLGTPAIPPNFKAAAALVYGSFLLGEALGEAYIASFPPSTAPTITANPNYGNPGNSQTPVIGSSGGDNQSPTIGTPGGDNQTPITSNPGDGPGTGTPDTGSGNPDAGQSPIAGPTSPGSSDDNPDAGQSPTAGPSSPGSGDDNPDAGGAPSSGFGGAGSPNPGQGQQQADVAAPTGSGQSDNNSDSPATNGDAGTQDTSDSGTTVRTGDE